MKQRDGKDCKMNTNQTTNNPKLCECGCGGLAPISKRTDSKNGYIVGGPKRFIKGHQTRGPLHPRFGKYGQDNPLYKENVKGHRWENNGIERKRDYIFIAQKTLGKSLPPKAVVHHYKDTLVICQDHSYHMFLHRRQKAFEKCGHANWRKCGYCHQYDDPKNLACINILGQPARHNSCRNIYRRLRYKLLKAGRK